MFRVAMRSRLSRASIVALEGFLLLAIAACDLLAKPAEPPRDPSVIGVVDSIEGVTSSASDVHLTNGQTVRLDYSATRDLYGSGPNPGDLLIYGDQPTAWRISLQPEANGQSYQVLSRIDEDGDRWITLDVGVRLPKADDYRASGRGPVEDQAPVTYVVSSEGEVVAGP